jgi:hypothetical protein
MTVTELFTLIIAARIPINVIQDYARYFPKAEWNQVLKAYGFHQITWNDTLIGRDEITEVIYESLLRRYSRILVGHPGVGKTALALQVLRRYSVHTGKPTYYIDMRQTTTFMMLLEQLATVFQVRAMGNEPLLYRIEAFVKHHSPCLLIDDFGQILPGEWLATGEEYHGHLHLREVVRDSVNRIDRALADVRIGVDDIALIACESAAGGYIKLHVHRCVMKQRGASKRAFR